MFKKLLIVFNFFIIFLISVSISKAELLEPNSKINPSEVVKIQLLGLQKNDDGFMDSGIEQTWNFAHPNNKKATGPLERFKSMIKGNNYQMMINHLSHTITQVTGETVGYNLK